MTTSHNRGFTLIEVALSLMILTLLSLALVQLMRGSFDIREGLTQDAKVNHRVASAMARLAKDLEHAYLLSEKDIARYGTRRKIKSIFVIELSSSGDTLKFTTMAHEPLMKNANESDTTYVVYRLTEDKDSGRMNLMRGAAKRVPEEFQEDPPMRLLARDIKSFKVRGWRGDEWMKDGWDSTRRETKGLLPAMVQVEIEGYAEDASESTSTRVTTNNDEPGVKYQTVLRLPNAHGMADLRSGASTIRWDRL